MSNDWPTEPQEPTPHAVKQGGGYEAYAVALVPWGWRDIGKALLLIIVGTILLSILLVGALVASGSAPDEMAGITTTPLFLLGIAIYVLVILSVYLYAVRRAETGWRALGWQAFSPGWVWALPFLTLIQLAGMALINTLFILPFVGDDFENPQIEAITGGGTLSVNDLLLLMVLIAIAAPVAEELFFRGMLYPLLRRRWSVVPAIVVNGLLFSVIHFIPPLLPGLFFVGMVLAWVRERSGSLIPCILLHAMQNGIVLLGIYAIANGVGT